MADDAPRVLFLHVMKTAGTTFVQHIHANVPSDEIYPSGAPGPERRASYYEVESLRAYLRTGGTARVFTGHFPSAVTELVEPDITMTVLREPVDRTISVLRHHKRLNPRLGDASLEEIYEDGWVRPMFVQDHQAKVFAMTGADKLESHMDVIEVDDDRLALAITNLERVDLVGLTERYDDFVGMVGERLGWQMGEAVDLNVSTEGWDVPADLRDRIAEDNPADQAFYAHAVQLVEARHGLGRT